MSGGRDVLTLPGRSKPDEPAVTRHIVISFVYRCHILGEPALEVGRFTEGKSRSRSDTNGRQLPDNCNKNDLSAVQRPERLVTLTALGNARRATPLTAGQAGRICLCPAAVIGSDAAYAIHFPSGETVGPRESDATTGFDRMARSFCRVCRCPQGPRRAPYNAEQEPVLSPAATCREYVQCPCPAVSGVQQGRCHLRPASRSPSLVHDPI